MATGNRAWALALAATLLAGLGLAGPAEAQTRGQNASPGHGLPDKAGYIGYSDAFDIRRVDDRLVKCANRTPASPNGVAALGPADKDGWIRHIDILNCETRKRVLRVENPNLRVPEDHNWATHNLGAWKTIEAGTGIVFYKRDGGWEMYDSNLKKVKVDPDRTLLRGGGDVVLLTDTPGVYIPYLSDGALPKLPKDMLGFTYIRVSDTDAAGDEVEVWRGADGALRYGWCAKDGFGDEFRRAPYCGPRYEAMAARRQTFSGEIFTNASSTSLLGLADGAWAVVQNDHLGVAPSLHMRTSFASQILPLGDADRAALTAASVDELEVKTQATYAAYMTLHDAAAKANARSYDTFADVLARHYAFEAEQARMRAAEAARQRAEREAAIERAKANDPSYCYRTDACNLGWAVRWNMAQGAGDYAASARIATESQWSSLIADDILAARGRRDRSIWNEQTIYQYASRDPRLQGLLGQTWKEAQLVEGNRVANQIRRDMEMDRAIARNAPLVLPEMKPGWQPLSTLEQDYYVGRGYVKVPAPK